MKTLTILAIGLCCVACTKQTKQETVTSEDTLVVNADTLVQEVTTVKETIPITESENDELIEEQGKMIYVSENQYSFISNPYDFELSVSALEDLLGEGVQTNVEEFEAGEDYSAYTYSTVTFKGNEISFYDFAGKHSAHITTPLLPLKNGIKIGMKKSDFQAAMGFESTNASKASVYRLVDDYGEMEFSFQSDTLSLIYAHYEEGD